MIERKKLFAEQLKKCLEQSGIMLSEAAQKACISPQMFKKYIDGRTIPRYDTIQKICIALHVRPNDLFGISAES